MTTIPVYVQSWNGPDKARLIGEASDALEMEDVAASHGIKFGFFVEGRIVTYHGERRWHLIVDDQYYPHVEPSPDYLAKLAFARLRRSSKRWSRRRCRHPRKFHSPRPCGYWTSEPALPSGALVIATEDDEPGKAGVRHFSERDFLLALHGAQILSRSHWGREGSTEAVG